MTNRFISAILLGIEYNIPMSIIGITNIALAIGSVLISIPRAAPFVSIMKVHACFFETMPAGMGLFFKLTLSRSASTRSFRMNMPTVIINVMKGAGIILWISSWMSVSEPIIFNIPGMQNTPAAVATE
jgi:hypothetical protein